MNVDQSTRRALVVAALAAGIVAAACGGGGGGKDATPAPSSATAAATQAAFDESLLTSVVLRAEDLPAGFTGGGYFNPPDPTVESRSFTTEFTNGDVFVQATVARYLDTVSAEAQYVHARQVVTKFGNTEENYAIPGADAAVLYRFSRPAGLMSWSIKGQYLVLVHVTALNVTAPAPYATDDAAFQTLATTVYQRLDAMIANPSAVTPYPDLAKTPAPKRTFTGE